jgi:hypothetical protein
VSGIVYLIYAFPPRPQSRAKILQLLAPLSVPFRPILQSFHRQGHRALVAPHVFRRIRYADPANCPRQKIRQAVSRINFGQLKHESLMAD